MTDQLRQHAIVTADRIFEEKRSPTYEDVDDVIADLDTEHADFVLRGPSFAALAELNRAVRDRLKERRDQARAASGT